MTWQTAAYISTVLQFFVIVASVFFIRKQLKAQTDLVRVANTQALVALVSPFNLEMAQNTKMAELWAIGPEEWKALSKEKKQQYESLLRWWFIFYENIFYQAKCGLLDEEIFDAWKKDLDVFVEEQLVEKHWSSLSKKYHNEFVDYLNTRIEEKNAKGDGSSS